MSVNYKSSFKKKTRNIKNENKTKRYLYRKQVSVICILFDLHMIKIMACYLCI